MKRLHERTQFQALGRLISLAPVVEKNTIKFVSCVRCLSDQNRKDISDTILEGRCSKGKYLQYRGKDVVLTSRGTNITNMLNIFKDEIIYNMKKDLNSFIPFNPEISEPGNRKTKILIQETQPDLLG